MPKIKLTVVVLIFITTLTNCLYANTNYKSYDLFDVEIAISTKNYPTIMDTIPKAIINKIDSIYIKLFYYHQEKKQDEVNSSIKSLTELIEPFEKNDPVFCGIIQLHQAYYAGNSLSSQPYIDKAIINLKDSGNVLANLYAQQFFWLIEGFYLENRQAEWQPIDKLYRNSINTPKISENERFSIAAYANLALSKKEYNLVNHLAKYDELYFKNQPVEDINNKSYVVFSQWLQLKQRLEKWIQIPYSDRNQFQFGFNEGQIIPDYLKDNSSVNLEVIKYDYKSNFSLLFKSLDELRQKAIEENNRSSLNYSEINRSNYFKLYETILQDFYTWATHDYKQSEAILPIKKFLYEDVIENEIKDAVALNQKPVIQASAIIGLYKNLSQLYYEIGNAELALQEITNSFANTEKIFNQKEQLNIILELIPNSIRAKRLENDFNSCENITNVFIKNAPKPQLLSSETLNEFEWYAAARIEEIFTLIAQSNFDKATELTITIIDEIRELPKESESIIYKTLAWTNLQYLTTLINAQNGNWNSVLIDEMVSDLLNNHPTSENFYPAQLLAIKSKWITEKEIHVDYLQNVLLYTERQLKNNFIFLTAEERMQLYALKLNSFFDVFHEFLFSGALEQYPDIKEKILSQSLHLKNALVDGNSIENEILLKNNTNLNDDLLNQLRALKQNEKIIHQVAKFQNIKTQEILSAQSMWLNIIENSKDDLVKMASWKSLSEKIKPNQVYLETVRYNKTLSDSMVVYGAYIITSFGKIDYFNICNEKELIAVLNNGESSPQCASINGNENRGSKGILTSDKKNTTFKNGNVDLLGQLLLKKIWKYTQGKTELLMVHDGLLNRISFAALQWDKKFTIDYLTLKYYSGSNSVGKQTTLPPKNSNVLLVGGINYGKVDTTENPYRLFKNMISWNYLPGTKTEVEMLKPIFDKAAYQSEVVTETNFTDSLTSTLGNYSFVHLATHGFYLDANSANILYDNQYNRDAMNLEPLYRCGLAIADANNPPKRTALETSGFMMGYELANTDLRNCYLISLSACETGLGDLRNNLGVDGLSRALKIAGAKNLLISLWKVPDEATAVFMKKFYTNLFLNNNPALALQITQKELSKVYPASAWAAFILVQ